MKSFRVLVEIDVLAPSETDAIAIVRDGLDTAFEAYSYDEEYDEGDILSTHVKSAQPLN